MRRVWLAVTMAAALALVGCGSTHTAGRTHTAGGTHTSAAKGIPRSLLAQARPIGRGARFHPPAPAAGPADRRRAATGTPVSATCWPTLGRRDGVHVELFAANRVVLIAAGIGTRPPRTTVAGRITHARCYGPLVTLDPTGVVLVAPGAKLTIADLFTAWEQPLGARRLLSFTSRQPVRAYVDGRRWTRTGPAGIPLTRHAEIVLEIGPKVPPHTAFTFPAGP